MNPDDTRRSLAVAAFVLVVIAMEFGGLFLIAAAFALRHH